MGLRHLFGRVAEKFYWLQLRDQKRHLEALKNSLLAFF